VRAHTLGRGRLINLLRPLPAACVVLLIASGSLPIVGTIAELAVLATIKIGSGLTVVWLLLREPE
jgi:hypothetical protein